MRKKVFIKFIPVILIALSFLHSCEKNTTTSTEHITIEDLRGHMEYIASGETEGRMTASSGFKKAADYIVSQFGVFGLEPGWKDEDAEKTFYQPVSFIRYHFGKNNNLSIRIEGGVQTLALGQHHFEIFYPGKGSMDIPMGNPVFVGSGIHEPDLGWDDYEGLDIEDKLVMILAGFPKNPNRGVALPSEMHQKYSDRRNGDFRRFLNVVERGAAGMIVIPDQNIVNNWETIMAGRWRSNLVPVEDYGPFLLVKHLSQLS